MENIKHAFFAAFLGVLLNFSTAHAQNVSAGGLNSDVLKETACMSELNLINETINNLENFVGHLESCNENGQTFNGTSCVDISGLTHQWLPDATNPTQLVLLSNGVEVKRVNVIKGRNGADAAGCPAGTTPQ